MTDHTPAPSHSSGGEELTTPNLASGAQPTSPVVGSGGSAPSAPRPGQSEKPGKLGLIALVCAVVGTIFAAWEGAYIVGWVLLPIAFIVSIVAIAMNSRRKMAVGALVLSIVGTVVGVVAFANSFDKAVDEAFSSASVPPAGTTATQGAKDSGKDSSTTDNAKDDEPTFKDGVYTGGGVTITIKGTRVIPVGEVGNQYGSKPILDIDYTITNNSATQEVNAAYFLMVFKATQDNDPNAINELQIGTDETEFEKYGDAGSQTIKVGGSVDYQMTYELDDTSTPVELVATTPLGKEIGRQTINLQ